MAHHRFWGHRVKWTVINMGRGSTSYFWHFCTHFKSVFNKKILSNKLLIHLCTHPYMNNLISPYITFTAWCDNPESTQCISCIDVCFLLNLRNKMLALVPETLLVIMKSHCALLMTRGTVHVNWESRYYAGYWSFIEIQNLQYNLIIGHWPGRRGLLNKDIGMRHSTGFFFFFFFFFKARNPQTRVPYSASMYPYTQFFVLVLLGHTQLCTMCHHDSPTLAQSPNDPPL